MPSTTEPARNIDLADARVKFYLLSTAGCYKQMVLRAVS
jgi:hypothetical protein